ncbi:MAG: ABC transporter ATP-binding protein [Calditrichaeota bacterium]|nr:MAG: ABC transporter ATP-binding protein [Calditrichota bacterium]
MRRQPRKQIRIKPGIEMLPLLKVESLKVHYFLKGITVPAVEQVGFEIRRRETLALVGESGCGKSTVALSLFKLVPYPGRILAGSIQFNGRELMSCSEKQMSRIRGKEMGLILQDSLSALNPVMRVGEQIAEVLRHHFSLSKKTARHRTIGLMERVQLPNAEKIYRAYPHQLSGGQRQRVVIAMALACRPALLVADEPTTALDVSIQSQIMALLQQLKAEFELSLLLISHDLAVVAQIADRVAVMYAGKIVERGTVRQVFQEPLHPYTRGLLQAMPGAGVRSGLAKPSVPLKGNVPDMFNLPPGCAFHPRCSQAMHECAKTAPDEVIRGESSTVRCHLYRPSAAPGKGSADASITTQNEGRALPCS